MKKGMYYRCLTVLLAGSLMIPQTAALAAEAGDGVIYEPGVTAQEMLEPETAGDFSEETAPPETEPVTETIPPETDPPETETSGETSETEPAQETEQTETTESESETEKTSESETEKETETETETDRDKGKEDTIEIPGSEKGEKGKEEEEGTDAVDGKEEDTVIEQGTIDYVRSSTRVPIDGLPGAITQEMVSAVLVCQDETGFPASVALAQILAESASSDAGSLTAEAYQTHNLFGIREGGSLKTYHTDTESIYDRSRILQESCRDLLHIVSDLDLFTSRFAARWSSDKSYGKTLIGLIDQYQLDRLDQMTLEDFEKLLPSYVNPCPGTVISSTFGYRELFQSMHEGIDLATGGRNIATYAARGGEVIFAGESGMAGNMICVQHADGTVTDYMHHAQMYVQAGDHVFKGQQIGLAGSTGRSTGIHLHFQVDIGGAAVNPAPYLKDDSSGESVPMYSGKRHKVTISKAVLSQVLHADSAQKKEKTSPNVKMSSLPVAVAGDIMSIHD